MMNCDLKEMSHYTYFPSSVYIVNKKEFLDSVNNVGSEYLNDIKLRQSLNEIHPVYMTDGFQHDSRLTDFVGYISQMAWNILNSQGYDMTNKITYLTEMWLQDHYKFSSMDSHIHSNDSRIVGFYFLECPEDSSRLVIHDPRPGKIQSNLPEKDPNIMSEANEMINFVPEVGQLIFLNSWLPHSFTRNASEKSFKFVHFCISTGNMQTKSPVIV